MVETSDSQHCQQHSPWESSAFGNCMIAPIELGQYEFLPASVNPCKGPVNLGLNGLGSHGLPGGGLMHEANGLIGKSWTHPQAAFLAPNGYLEEPTSLVSTGVDVQQSTYEVPSCPQQKRFLIFDKSGDETRLIFSSLCPRLQNPTTAQAKYPAWNPQDAPTTFFGANRFTAEEQTNKAGQVWTKTPIPHEESGENEIVEEGSEMQEDTDEINALLYSDDDDAFDLTCDGQDEVDDELSTGHSPSAIRGDCEKLEEQEGKDFDEVDSLDISLKRQRTLNGKHNDLSLLHAATMSTENLSNENIHGGDKICALDEEPDPTIGNKRPRKEKICDTLRALKSIIPGVKSKNPLVILDEAISYLKCLKYNAQLMSTEHLDSSSCYEPLN